jgi:hypothetical protein
MKTFLDLRSSPLLQWASTWNGKTTLLIFATVWCSWFPQTITAVFWALCLVGLLLGLCLIYSSPLGIFLLVWKAWPLFR